MEAAPIHRKPFAIRGDLHAARLLGARSAEEIHSLITRYRDWHYGVGMIERAIRHDCAEYVDDVPLIDVACRFVSPRLSTAITVGSRHRGLVQ